MKNTNIENKEALNHLRDKVNSVGVGMLSTSKQQGHPSACPMHTLDFDDHGAIWFYTFADSAKVEDLSDYNIANLIYSQPEKGIFISLTGPTQILDDRQKIEEYWQDRFKAWIPDGVASPGLSLLKVIVHEAESWDIETNKAIRFFKETKARIQDDVYEGGEHLVYRSKEKLEV